MAIKVPAERRVLLPQRIDEGMQAFLQVVSRMRAKNEKGTGDLPEKQGHTKSYGKSRTLKGRGTNEKVTKQYIP